MQSTRLPQGSQPLNATTQTEFVPQIVVALREGADIYAWIQLALALGATDDTITIRGMITVPPDRSLSESATQARQFREAVATAAADHPSVNASAEIRVDYQPMERVLDELSTIKADVILIDWGGPRSAIGGLESAAILERAACDVILLDIAAWTTDGPILLSLRGGPNLSLAIKVANALARQSSITFFHAADDRRIAELASLTRSQARIQRIITARSAIYEGLLREAPGHRAIILGATFQKPENKGTSTAPLINRLSETLTLPFVVVRARNPEPDEFHIPALTWRRTENLSTRVDRWFAENTFHSSEFADLATLMQLKEKQGVTISLGLPALDEEETIGKVIDTIKPVLMDQTPLIDEIVLIDSASTDQTVPIAQSKGVPYFVHQETLPEMGANRGKGEALWKSLYMLKGDLIAWIDTDITNIHPRFVYGLLGPLLRKPSVQYVKGFYQRPIQVNGKLQASGGGRVTELVARPLFNLFYPELSGIIQPLSGEYAGRRTALESVPFFSGYGVETGLLIDLLDRYGLESIAQVDLEERIHHNQPLVGLSKMSFAILQVFIARLEGRYGMSLLEHANRSMKLIISDPDRFALDIVEIGDVERPPMIDLPSYRNRQ